MVGLDQNLYVGIAGFAVLLYFLMGTMIARGAKETWSDSKRLEEEEHPLPTTE